MTNLWNKTDFNIGASLRRETFFFFLRKGRRRKEMGKRKKGRRKKRGEKLDRKKINTSCDKHLPHKFYKN